MQEARKKDFQLENKILSILPFEWRKPHTNIFAYFDGDISYASHSQLLGTSLDLNRSLHVFP